MGRRVRRTRGGDYQLRLPASERDVLRSIPEQLRELLASGDPSLVRLFPPAYPDDPEQNAEFERLVSDDLMEQKLRSAATMRDTIDAGRLSEDQVLAWLAAINDLRLVLGVRLEITDETALADFPEADRRAPMFALYAYLTALEDDVVDAVASG